MPSLPPFVHDFPYQNNAISIARPGKIEIPIVLVVRVLILRTVTSTSTALSLLVLPVNLPPSVPTCFGDYRRQIGFLLSSATIDIRTDGLPWVRRTTSPYSVRLHVSSIDPDIRSRLFLSARPSPQHHIAGSLFATYTGSTSCFLPAHRFQ